MRLNVLISFLVRENVYAKLLPGILSRYYVTRTMWLEVFVGKVW